MTLQAYTILLQTFQIFFYLFLILRFYAKVYLFLILKFKNHIDSSVIQYT